MNSNLLAILRCPKCRGLLTERFAEQSVARPQHLAALVCNACRLVYAITDEIPNLLIDEAQSLDC